MEVKIGLDSLTMEATVLGGVVLGCGGGGKLEDGLCREMGPTIAYPPPSEGRIGITHP